MDPFEHTLLQHQREYTSGNEQGLNGSGATIQGKKFRTYRGIAEVRDFILITQTHASTL